MRFLVDAQLPPALARLLRERGHEADHVEDEGFRHAEDSPIWEFCLARDAVLITKDEDFPHRALQSKRLPAPPIVWLRVGNCSRKALLRWFEPMLPEIERLLARGERIIEVR